MTMHPNLLVVILGGVIVLSLLMKTGCSRLRTPPLIGYLAIGFLLRFLDDKSSFLPEQAYSVFELLAKLGVICLLFGVGIKSDIHKMLGHLKGASLVWIGNVLGSGVLGFWATRTLGFEVVPSLMTAAALTATSVGVPAAVWERRKAVDTDEGQFFLDVAELDDLSGILLLTLLFGMMPVLRDLSPGDAGLPWGELLLTSSGMLGKLILFGAACFVFARFAENPLMRFLSHRETGTDAVISCTCVGILIAGLAGLMGFSVAIGAFFAGLAFSRNRDAIRKQTPYQTLYDLFVPFFFIGIGLKIPVAALGEAWKPGMALLAAAVAGKLGGAILPARGMLGKWGGAFALGVSLVPRAEIAMIIMTHGREAGQWAVPADLFSAMVWVVLGTCCLAPPLLDAMLRRGV